MNCKHKYEGRMGRKITAVDPGVMAAFCEYNWPGNIRELENLIERALILTKNNTLEYGDWVPVKKLSINKKTSLQKMENVEK